MNFTAPHVVIAYINLKKMLNFYQLLGFTTYHKQESSTEIEYFLKNSENFIIKLFHSKELKPKVNKTAVILDNSIKGPSGLGIAVANIEVFYEYLSSKNTNILTAVEFNSNFDKYFDIKDPEGNIITIAEITPTKAVVTKPRAQSI